MAQGQAQAQQNAARTAFADSRALRLQRMEADLVTLQNLAESISSGEVDSYEQYSAVQIDLTDLVARSAAEGAGVETRLLEAVKGEVIESRHAWSERRVGEALVLVDGAIRQLRDAENQVQAFVAAVPASVANVAIRPVPGSANFVDQNGDKFPLYPAR